MSCSLQTILLRRTSGSAEGCFFKAAHGFPDLSGWFTFHVEWTGWGGVSFEVPYGCLVIETSPPLLSFAVYPNSLQL